MGGDAEKITEFIRLYVQNEAQIEKEKEENGDTSSEDEGGFKHYLSPFFNAVDGAFHPHHHNDQEKPDQLQVNNDREFDDMMPEATPQGLGNRMVSHYRQVMPYTPFMSKKLDFVDDDEYTDEQLMESAEHFADDNLAEPEPVLADDILNEKPMESHLINVFDAGSTNHESAN